MSAVVREFPKEPMSVRAVARSALSKAGGNVIEATRLMEQEIRNNMSKYRALMDPLVSEACYSAITALQRGNRKTIWTAPNYTAGGNGKRVHALSAGNLLMFPLPSGQALGSATKAEVLEAAKFYDSQALNMKTKAHWLLLVAKRLRGRTPVAKVFTNEALQTLKAEAENE